MINFNVPPFIDKAMDYMRECVENQKICGDGSYTKKCNEWFEKKTGTAKCLLTTSCTHATEMAALLRSCLREMPGRWIFILRMASRFRCRDTFRCMKKLVSISCM